MAEMVALKEKLEVSFCANPLFVSSVTLLFKPFLPQFVPMTVALHFDLSSRVNHTTLSLRKRVVLIQFRGL